MAERFTGAGLAAKPTINLSTDGGTVVGTTQLDGSQQINLVAGAGIILTGTSPDSITIQSTGGGGGGSVTAVTTTLSGITITNPTTTPEISGTLGVSSGGTGTTTLADGGILLGSGAGAITATAQPTDGQLLIGSTGTDPVLATLSAGSGISITEGSGTITIAATGGGGSGTVTSVDVSGGTTGLTYSGGPITTSGTITMAGTLAVAHGGTGATTDAGARTNLGLGTMATQDANSVAITGGSISGVSGVGSPSQGSLNQFNVADGSGGWNSASVYFHNSGSGGIKIGSSSLPNYPIAAIATGSQVFVGRFVSQASQAKLAFVHGSGNNSAVAFGAESNRALIISNQTEYLFPSSDGSSGDVLTTDGSGNLSFTTPGGGGYTSWIAKGGGGLTTSIDSGDTLEIAGGTGITTTLSGTGTTTPTLTIDVDGSIPTGSGTAGQVTFWDGAASITGNAAFTFNSATTTLDLEGDLQIRDSTIVQGSTNFSAGNQGNSATFDGIAATDFRSCKYVIQITDATAGDYQVTEILLLNDGASGDVVEYGTIYSGSPLGINFNSSLSLGTISPFFTIDTNNAITVDFVRTLLFPA